MKTRKILAAGLAAVRHLRSVPVLRAHSESVNIAFTGPFPLEEARRPWRRRPASDCRDFETTASPMPTDVTGRARWRSARIRQDLSDQRP